MKENENILQQEWISLKGVIHPGEIIRDPMGISGWLDWTDEPYATPGIKTAKLENVLDKFEVYVYKEFRTKNFKVGTDLLRKVILRLREKHYQEFLVLGAITATMPFYKEAIQTLVNEELLVSSEVFSDPPQPPNDSWDIRATIKPN